MGETLIKVMIQHDLSPIEELRKALETLNRHNINYVVLRNYEFLLGDKDEKLGSLDIVLDEKDIMRTKKILQGIGYFTERPRSFSFRHIGFSKYLPEYKTGVGFDTQVQNIYWNDMPYLFGNDFFPKKKMVGFFYTLSDEDSFIMFVVHSILGKRRFKEKYKHILRSLYKSNLDMHYINAHLYRIFGKRVTKDIIEKISSGNFIYIEKKIRTIVIIFLIKNLKRLVTFLRVATCWLIWKSRKTPLIAFMGPDGAGKSTTVAAVRLIIENSNRKVKHVYLGRGKANLFPIAKAGKAIKEKIMHESIIYKKLFYTLSSFIFALDLLLRYLVKIRMIRHGRKIILTDRYATDIYLMPYVGSTIRNILFSLFPKPNLTFYLYNEPEVLHKRRPKHSIKELKGQLRLYNEIANRIGALKIKTDNEEKVLNDVSIKVFDYLNKTGF